VALLREAKRVGMVLTPFPHLLPRRCYWHFREDTAEKTGKNRLDPAVRPSAQREDWNSGECCPTIRAADAHVGTNLRWTGVKTKQRTERDEGSGVRETRMCEREVEEG
jgi:hypothetical protein